MARNGFKIFDSDTHVGPYMEVIDRYLSDAERRQVAHIARLGADVSARDLPDARRVELDELIGRDGARNG